MQRRGVQAALTTFNFHHALARAYTTSAAPHRPPTPRPEASQRETPTPTPTSPVADNKRSLPPPPHSFPMTDARTTWVHGAMSTTEDHGHYFCPLCTEPHNGWDMHAGKKEHLALLCLCRQVVFYQESAAAAAPLQEASGSARTASPFLSAASSHRPMATTTSTTTTLHAAANNSTTIANNHPASTRRWRRSAVLQELAALHPPAARHELDDYPHLVFPERAHPLLPLFSAFDAQHAQQRRRDIAGLLYFFLSRSAAEDADHALLYLLTGVTYQNQRRATAGRQSSDAHATSTNSARAAAPATATAGATRPRRTFSPSPFSTNITAAAAALTGAAATTPSATPTHPSASDKGTSSASQGNLFNPYYSQLLASGSLVLFQHLFRTLSAAVPAATEGELSALTQLMSSNYHLETVFDLCGMEPLLSLFVPHAAHLATTTTTTTTTTTMTPAPEQAPPPPPQMGKPKLDMIGKGEFVRAVLGALRWSVEEDRIPPPAAYRPSSHHNTSRPHPHEEQKKDDYVVLLARQLVSLLIAEIVHTKLAEYSSRAELYLQETLAAATAINPTTTATSTPHNRVKAGNLSRSLPSNPTRTAFRAAEALLQSGLRSQERLVERRQQQCVARRARAAAAHRRQQQRRQQALQRLNPNTSQVGSPRRSHRYEAQRGEKKKKGTARRPPPVPTAEDKKSAASPLPEVGYWVPQQPEAMVPALECAGIRHVLNNRFYFP